MNKTVKYVLAIAVSLAMLFGFGFDIVAQLPPAEGKPVNTGEINVSVAPALALSSDLELTAQITGADSKTSSQTILFSSEHSEDNKTEAAFRELAPGEYTLKVSAPGFADYVQKLDVGTQATSVKLLTGFIEGFSYKENALHPGALLIGDVNGDGIIDDMDKDILVDAVDADKTENAT
ncbi:MAG: carboxypeptidase-like regulatory domain-containing protein, partial [Ruminiclostridium sp.]|nr:carboxypeptidase-like regulatory domain-containing protein [Ruminiclostridium sp.]